jgi:hypothetical protein
MSARRSKPRARRKPASEWADPPSASTSEESPTVEDRAEGVEVLEQLGDVGTAQEAHIPSGAAAADGFDTQPLPEPVADDEPDPEAGLGSAAIERRVRPVRRRRASRAHRVRSASADGVDERPPVREPSEAPARTSSVAARGVRTVLAVILIVVVLLGALFGIVVGVNAFARWNARRIASTTVAGATAAANNLLIIGVRDGVAVGFTALKAERASNRVLGIAIPDGAFVEVPGQGFERIGSSFLTGPGVSKDTVSNYLGVPFRRYVVVDGDTYQAFLRDQNVAGLMQKVSATDLTASERASFVSYFATVKTKDVWIASLPVKPVAVGDQRYFEPQRAQVADLLLQWWGVRVSQEKSTPRVIVYNGVGTPGLAGLAAQQLIRTGLRVVNSGNAQNFDYTTTQILLYHGTQADAEAVRSALGAGEIIVQSAPQEVADMIVIIGADYRPPVADASTLPTEGVK